MFKTVFLALVAASLTIVLMVSLTNRLRVYRRYEIGVTVTKEEHFEEIPFPAISICLQHYDLQKLKDDIGIPANPFAPKKSSWMSDPNVAYRLLGDGLNMTDFLHKYYAMPGQILLNSDNYAFN